MPNEFQQITTGIYFLCKQQEVIYVGQSCQVPARIEQHNGSKDFDSVLAISVPTHLLNEVERYWIEHIKPRLNASYKAEPERKKSITANPRAPVEESPTCSIEWAVADYVTHKFGIPERLLNAVADENRIRARYDGNVRLFNIQSIRDLLEANIV